MAKSFVLCEMVLWPVGTHFLKKLLTARINAALIVTARGKGWTRNKIEALHYICPASGTMGTKVDEMTVVFIIDS